MANKKGGKVKSRIYRVYWTTISGKEASKDIGATNIDELIDILREVMVDEGFEKFVVFNPEGINILTETDLITRR